jgi:hypothetical protein
MLVDGAPRYYFRRRPKEDVIATNGTTLARAAAERVTQA